MAPQLYTLRPSTNEILYLVNDKFCIGFYSFKEFQDIFGGKICEDSEIECKSRREILRDNESDSLQHNIFTIV